MGFIDEILACCQVWQIFCKHRYFEVIFFISMVSLSNKWLSISIHNLKHYSAFAAQQLITYSFVLIILYDCLPCIFYTSMYIWYAKEKQSSLCFSLLVLINQLLANCEIQVGNGSTKLNQRIIYIIVQKQRVLSSLQRFTMARQSR